MLKTVEDEIKDIIEIPTVLLDRDGYPIEYKKSREKRKMKIRTLKKPISIHLMMLTLQNGGDLSSLEKFSSGNYIGFLNMNRVYTIL